MTIHPALDSGIKLGFAESYLEALALVERLHRLLLDVIKDEFERINVLEINPVQALLLFNIGENEVTAGELKSRGYHQGSTVSYNLKKMVEMGYMHHQRSEIDRRSVRVRLTEKGPLYTGHRCRAICPSCRRFAKQRCAWLGGYRGYHQFIASGGALLDRPDTVHLLTPKYSAFLAGVDKNQPLLRNAYCGSAHPPPIHTRPHS